jgi:hypothetical protein
VHWHRLNPRSGRVGKFVSRVRPYQGFAHGGQETGERNWAAVLGPRFAIHFDPELAMVPVGQLRELNFKVFVAAIILDRISQICFHKTMITKAKTISIVHALVHRWSYIKR